MKMNAFRIMTYPYLAWISAMIVIPMILILFYAFTIEGNDVVSIKFSLENFTRFVTDATFLRVVAKSLWIAFLTTIISIIIGYPIAYVISKARGRHGLILILLLTLPTWINMLVRTYAWMGILQEGGILSKFLELFGISGVSLLYTDFAVTLGMVYNFLPFMILQIHTSLVKMDNSLLEAAADLGASRFQSFWRVTFPLSLRRKRHRKPVFNGRRLEFRIGDFIYHGGYHYILDVADAKNRRPTGKGGVDDG